MNSKLILPIVFIAVLAVSRIPGLMPWNFSVAYAFVFCVGVYFPRKLSWWLPLVVMFATDMGLNCYYQHAYPDYNVWSAANLANLSFNYIAYVALIFLGRCFKPKMHFLTIVGGGLLGAILFYLITNTASWLFNPFGNAEYTKNLMGWITALINGVKGYPSTWEFFRSTLFSAGLFTAFFAAAEKLMSESPADKTAGAPQESEEESEKPEEAKA